MKQTINPITLAVWPMIRSNGGLTATGGLWPMFTSSLWLGARLAAAYYGGADVDDLDAVIHEGIMVGGDVDTRLALALPFLSDMSDESFEALGKKYPPLWRAEEIEQTATRTAQAVVK